jgi:hypothetical protein
MFPELERVPIPETAPGGKLRSKKTLPRRRLKELEDWFTALYTSYPRHDKKQDAWKAFLKLAPDYDMVMAMAKDIDRRVRDGEWEPDDKERRRFIPQLSTYLNQKRWIR